MTSEQAQREKIQMKRVKQRRREQRYCKGLPLVENFKLDAEQTHSVTVECMVKEGVFVTPILEFGKVHGKYGITKIVCPECGDDLKLDKHWDAFVCNRCKLRLEVIDTHDDIMSTAIEAESSISGVS